MKMEAPISNSKVDICFSNSLESVKNHLLFRIVLHLLQFITMAIMIPLDIYVFDNQTEVLSFFISALVTVFILFIAKVSHYTCQLNNPHSFMAIATDLNHVVGEEPQSERLSHPGTEVNLNFVSQSMYNVQTNISIAEVTPLVRASVEPAVSNMIRSLALSRDPLNRCTINIFSFVSICLFIFGIVLMAKQPMQLGQIIVMVLFLISEFLIEIEFFACVLFIALVPLMCLFVCIFMCCCKAQQKQAKLPPAVPVDINIIQITEGSPCSICFQSFILQQQVIVLPCAPSHVFHDKCISAWAVVKPTCPICRFDLTQ